MLLRTATLLLHLPLRPVSLVQSVPYERHPQRRGGQHEPREECHPPRRVEEPLSYAEDAAELGDVGVAHPEESQPCGDEYRLADLERGVRDDDMYRIGEYLPEHHPQVGGAQGMGGDDKVPLLPR